MNTIGLLKARFANSKFSPSSFTITYTDSFFSEKGQGSVKSMGLEKSRDNNFYVPISYKRTILGIFKRMKLDTVQ